MEQRRRHHTHNARRRRPVRQSNGQTAEPETKRERRRGRRLAASWILFLLVVVMKFLLPNFFAPIERRLEVLMGINVDYQAAVMAIGEAISGETEFVEAMGEAYTHAFGAYEQTEWISE